MTTAREAFEAWLDRVTKHQDSVMPTPWKVWQAATAYEREACAKYMDDCGEFEHAIAIRARSNDD